MIITVKLNVQYYCFKNEIATSFYLSPTCLVVCYNYYSWKKFHYKIRWVCLLYLYELFMYMYLPL